MLMKLLSEARFLRERARADYLDAERDLVQRFGATAARHLGNDDRRLLAYLGRAVGWKRLRRIAHMATVRTIRAWFRSLIGTTLPRSDGRVSITPEVQALVIKFALENNFGNDAWGRRRIVGELDKLGIDLSSSSVRRILRHHGIPPAPKRGRGRDHDLTLVGDHSKTVAIDFAQTAILDAGQLRLMYILLAIHIPTRKATVVGLTEFFDDTFLAQCARNLTMADVGFLPKHHATTIIMDRDSLFTAHFKGMLAEAGVTITLIAPQCPLQNGYIKRLIGTLKSLALHKVLCLSESDLWHVLDAAINHYNRERPHKSLGNKPIMEAKSLPDVTKPIVRISNLGGAIHHYQRAA